MKPTMKIARFSAEDRVCYGLVEGDIIREVEGGLVSFIGSGLKTTGRSFALKDVKLLAPCTPSKLVCIGLNYRAHAQELNMSLPKCPIVFMKPSTSVIGPEGKIIMPPQSKRVDYEAELAVVIGCTAYRVSREKALDYILGYTCGNDVTARDMQPSDGQWIYAKGFDTFAPLGPFIETEIKEPDKLDIKGYLNGRVVQSSNTEDMIFDVAHLVEYITACMTLLPGDVIMTGTPSGIGLLKDGDIFTVEVEKIGRLTNKACQGVATDS